MPIVFPVHRVLGPGPIPHGPGRARGQRRGSLRRLLRPTQGIRTSRAPVWWIQETRRVFLFQVHPLFIPNLTKPILKFRDTLCASAILSYSTLFQPTPSLKVFKTHSNYSLTKRVKYLTKEFQLQGLRCPSSVQDSLGCDTHPRVHSCPRAGL